MAPPPAVDRDSTPPAGNLAGSPIGRWLMAAVVCAPLFAGLTGCAVLDRMFHRPPPCVLQPGAGYQEIVAKVNQNFSAPTAPPLEAWECTDVWMSLKGMPTMARASVSVRAPHQLRIRASNPITGSELADLGSNSEEVWFWGQGGPGVITASHEELPQFLSQMQIPFEPEWLMEVLGVVPIDPAQFELVRPTPDAGYVDLVADRSAPNGEPVRRVIRVDVCHGRVLEHRVEAIDGTRIAVAHLDDYEADATGRYALPGFIRLEWPQTNTEMTLRLRRIQTDPERLMSSNWTVPRKTGYAQLRVGQPSGPEAEFSGESGPGEILPVGERRIRSLGARLTLPVLTEDAPPEAYFEAASQLSSDPLRPEPATGPRPYP